MLFLHSKFGVLQLDNLLWLTPGFDSTRSIQAIRPITRPSKRKQPTTSLLAMSGPVHNPPSDHWMQSIGYMRISIETKTVEQQVTSAKARILLGCNGCSRKQKSALRVSSGHLHRAKITALFISPLRML